MAARKGRRECARNRRTLIMSPRFAILARRARRERRCRIAIHPLADTGSRTLSGAIITIFVIAYAAIAANAGGAWSAIGDVTTTMLWIGGQITPLAIIKGVFLASLVNLVLPLFFVGLALKGKEIVAPDGERTISRTSVFERNMTFF